MEGEPAMIIRNLKTTENGAEVWRTIQARYEVRGTTLAQSYALKLASFEWPKHRIIGVYESLERIEKWKFECHTLSGNPYGEEPINARI